MAMERLSKQYREAREVVKIGRERDLRRGFVVTFLVLASSTWLVSLGLLVFFAARVSRPIHELTGGLSELAAGNFAAPLLPARDEVGHAIRAFNHTAEQLAAQPSPDLTQLASGDWRARWPTS
jgi:nitrogen fixation/metabolism regulation signal transduction histidine kinase